MKQRNIVLIPLLLIALISCKKENQDPNNLSASKPIGVQLKNTKWQITSMIADTERTINGQKSHDWFSIYKPCRKDNIYTFGGTENQLVLSIDEGKESCNKESQTVNMAMLFQVNNETKTLKGHTTAEEGSNRKLFDTPDNEDNAVGIQQEWKIKELSADKMKVSVQILDELFFVEYTTGKPTIEMELKRVN